MAESAPPLSRTTRFGPGSVSGDMLDRGGTLHETERPAIPGEERKELAQVVGDGLPARNIEDRDDQIDLSLIPVRTAPSARRRTVGSEDGPGDANKLDIRLGYGSQSAKSADRTGTRTTKRPWAVQ